MGVSKSAAAIILSLITVGLIAGILLKASLHGPEARPDADVPASTLWSVRDFETILQGLLILGGVFAILMLLGSSGKGAEG